MTEGFFSVWSSNVGHQVYKALFGNPTTLFTLPNMNSLKSYCAIRAVCKLQLSPEVDALIVATHDIYRHISGRRYASDINRSMLRKAAAYMRKDARLKFKALFPKPSLRDRECTSAMSDNDMCNATMTRRYAQRRPREQRERPFQRRRRPLRTQSCDNLALEGTHSFDAMSAASNTV